MEYKHIKTDTYATIVGSMIIDLGLKGNELLVYALINGFSQDGQSEFYGSLAYLQEFTSLSKQGVLNTINSLIEKGMIEKIQTTRNGVTFNSYKTLKVVKKFDNQSRNLTENLNNINNKETISKDISKRLNRKEMALPFDSPRLRELWCELMDYEEWQKKSNHAIELRIKKLERVAGGDVKVAIASIKQTLDKVWEDFYPPKSEEYFDKEVTQVKKRPIWEELGMTKEQYLKITNQ